MENKETIETKEHADNGGRPPYFTKVEDLENMVKEYFELFEEETTKEQRKARGIEVYENRPTITGLTLFLGFMSRDAFYKYEKKEGFGYAIKAARSKIENLYENMMGTKTGTVGAIFALKNMGWSDKTEIDHTSGGEKIQSPPPINVYSGAPPFAGDESEVQQTKLNDGQ